ncbi:hypothetical protein ABH957_002069 [Bacillus sp. RC242]
MIVSARKIYIIITVLINKRDEICEKHISLFPMYINIDLYTSEKGFTSKGEDENSD